MAPTVRSSIWPKALRRDAPGAVDDDQAGGAPQLVAAHGDGQGGAGVVGVDADGERDSVLVQERFERGWGHGVVVLEHGVQPQHGDGVAEGVLDALGLGQPVGDAARHSIWNASITTTSPPRSARVGLPAVLNQRAMASSGAAGYVDCMLNAGCAPGEPHNAGGSADHAG